MLTIWNQLLTWPMFWSLYAEEEVSTWHGYSKGDGSGLTRDSSAGDDLSKARQLTEHRVEDWAADADLVAADTQ